MLIIIAALGFSLWLTRDKKKIIEMFNELDKSLNQTGYSDINEVYKTKEQLMIEIADMKNRKFKRLLTRMYWGNVMTIIEITLFVVVVGFNFVTTSYEINAISHFQQMISIDSPFITDKDRLLFVSRFAQIKNSNDYTTLVKQIEDIATKNGQDVPSFTIW